jgi:hypothetical protein
MMNKACLEHRRCRRWPDAASSLLRIGLAVFGVLAASSHADAAIALVAHTATGSSGGGGNDVVTSAAINTTGANLCIASVAEYTGGSGFGLPTDSGSAGAWTGLTTRTYGIYRVRLFYKAITTSSSHTFGTSGAIGSFPSLAVACFSGVDSSPFDVEAAGGGVGTGGQSVQPGSVTPTVNDELVISTLNFSSANAAPPPAVSVGTITDQVDYSQGITQGVVLSYQIQTTAAATNPTYSWVAPGWAVATSATFKSATASSTGLVQTSKITCAGTFRIAVPQGSFTDFSHGITAMTFKFDTTDNKRHYFALAGDGHVLESVEPTLSPCSTAVDMTPFALAASWGTGGIDGGTYGSDWGAYPLSSNSGCPGNLTDYLPGECGQVKPAGLKWDSANSYLLETWYPTYGTPASTGVNSVAAVTMNNSLHSMSLVGCWAAYPDQKMQQVGGGVIIPPAAWVTANGALLPSGPNGYWLLGLGGATGDVQLVSNGPTMMLVPVPTSGNACTNGTTTPYPTAAGVQLANFEANTNGPTCGGSSPGCNTAGSPPTFPSAAKTAFTGYSSTFSPYWWDPYGGHGWFWGGTAFGMDWYDDGVVQGVLVPFSDVSGWARGTVLSSPTPTYNAGTSIGTFSTSDPITTHDGYSVNVGDAIWVQTCVAGTDPNCDSTNAHDWTWATITGISGTGPYDFTYFAWGPDTGTGNHVPVPSLGWSFGPFYGHGAGGGMFPRAMFRLQVIDPAEYTKVLDGTYTTADQPTYTEDIDASSLFPQFGGPSTGTGVSQNFGGFNANTAPSWAGADPARQQFLVNISMTYCTNGPSYSFCAQIYVWDIGH